LIFNAKERFEADIKDRLNKLVENFPRIVKELLTDLYVIEIKVVIQICG
jgi:hypothetical protein